MVVMTSSLMQMYSIREARKSSAIVALSVKQGCISAAYTSLTPWLHERYVNDTNIMSSLGP